MRCGKHRPLFARLAEGPLLTAIEKSEQARLKKFVVDADSEPLRLFHASQRDRCLTGDWYGEHVGKWLVAATRAYHRTRSDDWAERIAQVVEYLADQQEPSGYLGTYSPESSARFTHPGAEGVRTWDLWIHSWLLLGLMDAAAVPGADRAVEVARKVGELLLSTFGGTGRSPVDQGNHDGLSSLVLLEPLARLAGALDDPRYTALATRLLVDAKERGLSFFASDGRTEDAASIGTGKAYQLIWCLQGMLALHRLTNDPSLLAGVEALWANIRQFHLTPMGGPWGGIATHKEVFNAPGFFHPSGMVETCSSATWMTLSQSLFAATGNPDYLIEVEKTLFNSILAAQDENGSDWCYFTFPNGPRNNTYHWACCKSSGAMALELCSDAIATEQDGVPSLNMLVSCSFETSSEIQVTATMCEQELVLSASAPTPFRLLVPPYALIDARPEASTLEGPWLTLPELGTDPITLSFQMPVRVMVQANRVEHHGQEIFREEYVCVARGRHLYATGKFDGFKTQETLRLPQLYPESVFSVVGPEAIELRLPGQDPVLFTPYWQCGGQRDGAWRTAWLQVAWQ